MHVLFSSVGSGLGDVGQSNYAAGNSCLDAYALAQSKLGVLGVLGCARVCSGALGVLTTCSLQWPLIGGAGMGAATYAAVSDRQVVGMAGISLEQYAACIEAQLFVQHSIGQGVQLIHRANVAELLQDLADPSQPRFCELGAQVDVDAGRMVVAQDEKEEWGCAALWEAAQAAAASPLAKTLAPLTEAARFEYVQAAVLRIVRELSDLPATSLEIDTPLMEAGVDSLAATEFASRLRSFTGVPISPTIVFERPSPRAITSHLVEQIAAVEGVVAAAPATVVRMDEGLQLGVLGLVGRWAGGVNSCKAREQLQHPCGDAMSSVPMGARACDRRACALLAERDAAAVLEARRLRERSGAL